MKSSNKKTGNICSTVCAEGKCKMKELLDSNDSVIDAATDFNDWRSIHCKGCNEYNNYKNKIKDSDNSVVDKDDSSNVTTQLNNVNASCENVNAYGWICPRCGKVHAPWVSTCGCTPGVQQLLPLPYTYYPYMPDRVTTPAWPSYITCTSNSEDKVNVQQ